MKKNSPKGLSLFLQILIASLILLLGAYLGKELALVMVCLAAFLLTAVVVSGLVVIIIATIKEEFGKKRKK